jgi:hypothetical protein
MLMLFARFCRALAVPLVVTIFTVSTLATFATPVLLKPGVWKSTTENTLVTEEGKKRTPTGKAELTLCLTPQFVATNPYFNDDPAMGEHATKAKSCRHWPISQSVTATKGAIQMRFECKLENDSLIWVTIGSQGTPSSVETKLRVFREGGTGYVDVVTRMTRSDEACTKEMLTPDVSANKNNKTHRASTVVTQPLVNFAGETYFYDGVEMAGTATHNNYYPAEESRTDWRKEFSASQFPNTATPNAYVALITENSERPLLKGTKIETLAKSSDGNDMTIWQLISGKRSDGQSFVMHSVARAVKSATTKGVKVYSIETDHDVDKLPNAQILAETNKRYAAALASVSLPVYDAEAKALATAANATKPILFNGQSYRFDTGIVTLTHIFNGYVPGDEDANVANRSLWVNLYPTANSVQEIIEWTKEQFASTLVKGTKFESLIKVQDGSSETLLYLNQARDGKGIEMSIARFTKDQDGVKVYRYQNSFSGTLVEHGANIRASMRKIANQLGELDIPVVNEERTSPFAKPTDEDLFRDPTESELNAASALTIEKKTFVLKRIRERSDDIENFYLSGDENINDHTSALVVRFETDENDPVDRCKRFGEAFSKTLVAGTKPRTIRNLKNGKDITCTVVFDYDKETIAFYVVRMQKIETPQAVQTYRFYMELPGTYAQHSANIEKMTESVANQLGKLDRPVVGKAK